MASNWKRDNERLISRDILTLDLKLVRGEYGRRWTIETAISVQVDVREEILSRKLSWMKASSAIRRSCTTYC